MKRPSAIAFLFLLLANMHVLPAQERYALPDTLKRNDPDLERWAEEQIMRREDSVKRALRPDTVRGSARRNVPDLERWAEERIVRWEDSVKQALYPEPAIGSVPLPKGWTGRPVAKAAKGPVDFANKSVPDSWAVDQAKDVGAIPMASSTSPAGAKVYTVPIAASPGRAGFQPQLSLAYNSMAGNGTMGVGWGIGGLSAITRVPRSIYYDGRAQGVERKKTDAFTLSRSYRPPRRSATRRSRDRSRPRPF